MGKSWSSELESAMPLEMHICIYLAYYQIRSTCFKLWSSRNLISTTTEMTLSKEMSSSPCFALYRTGQGYQKGMFWDSIQGDRGITKYMYCSCSLKRPPYTGMWAIICINSPILECTKNKKRDQQKCSPNCFDHWCSSRPLLWSIMGISRPNHNAVS